jgi:DNA-binding LytR/AlgR family response regulator
LDIDVPGLNSFEVTKALQVDVMPLIVFATAYDQVRLRRSVARTIHRFAISLGIFRLTRAVLSGL